MCVWGEGGGGGRPMSSHWSIHRGKCHFPTGVYLQVKHVGETHCSLATRVKEHNDIARNNVQGQPPSDHDHLMSHWLVA